MEEGKVFVLRSKTKQKTHHSFIIIINSILFCSTIQVRVMTFTPFFYTRKSQQFLGCYLYYNMHKLVYENVTGGKKYWVALFLLCCWTDKRDNIM